MSDHSTVISSEEARFNETHITSSDTSCNLCSSSLDCNTSELDPFYNHETLKPTYFVPKEFYVLNGKGESRQNRLFIGQRGFFKSVSASYKSRQNLHAHIKREHFGTFKKFDELCSNNDKRKQNQPDGNATFPGITTASENKTLAVNIIDQELTALCTSNGVKKPKLSQKDFDLGIAQYIAEIVLPYNHIEAVGFKNFMAGCFKFESLNLSKIF